MARNESKAQEAVQTQPLRDDEREDTRSALEQYLDWQARQLATLGIDVFTEDVKADNPTLVAALRRIESAGAPAPTITREVIALPTGAGTWSTDIYTYTSARNPRVSHRSVEYLLALQPDVVVAELRGAGII